MTGSNVERELSEAEREARRAAAQQARLEAALAAYADGRPDLAQLLPGRAPPPRRETPARLVW